MTQLALHWEPFELRPPDRPPLTLVGRPLETMIDRVPSDPRLAVHLHEWKHLRDDGWDVHALLAPDSQTVVLLAARGGDPR